MNKNLSLTLILCLLTVNNDHPASSITPLEEKVDEKTEKSNFWKNVKGYGAMIGAYFMLGGAGDLTAATNAADAQFFGDKDQMAKEIPVGEKETKVFGTADETTTLDIYVEKDTGGDRKNARVIIDNGTIADTLLTNNAGVAVFTNSPVTDVEENENYVKNTGKITTTEWPQVSQEKFTMYAYFGKDINLPDGTVIGEGKVYTLATLEEVGTVPIIVKDDIAIMHFDGSNLANAPYAYMMSTEYGIGRGRGKIIKIDNGWEGAFNDINSGIIEKLDVYKEVSAETLTKAQGTNSTQATTVNITIESLPNDFNKIEKLEDVVEIEIGQHLMKDYVVTTIENGVTYTIIAKDLNTEKVLEGTELSVGLIKGTSNEKGEIIIDNVQAGYHNLYVTATNNYYGVDEAPFTSPQPQTVADLTDTLIVYLWNKDRPLPGTDETRKPSLYEIKEMSPEVDNLQRALGKEVHNLSVMGEQLENAKKFYAHIDSMVFNNEWGITLKTNDPYDYANRTIDNFSLDNIQNYWYNIITDGGNNAEKDGIFYSVARAPPQSYTIFGQAHIHDFQETPEEDPAVGKEIVFRLGDHGSVGSRTSVGNATPSWFTETDRTLLYPYLKHDRATLSNNNVIYYPIVNMIE